MLHATFFIQSDKQKSQQKYQQLYQRKYLSIENLKNSINESDKATRRESAEISHVLDNLLQ